MKIPIIGTSILKFGDLWEKGIEDLIKEACQKAILDAGLRPSEVDSIFVANEFASATGQSLLSSAAYEATGIANCICVNGGDAAGAIAIKLASNSIMAGESDVVVVVGAEKVSDLKANEINSLSSNLLSQKEEGKAGATPQIEFAIMTKKYLHDFGMNSHDLHFIPSMNHKNAVANESAQYRFELSEEKIGSSPMVAEPIRLLETASYCDGAAAIVMCSPRLEKRFAKKVKCSLVSSSVANDSLSLSRRKSITSIDSTAKASKAAFESAGIRQKDIGLMEVYDFAPIGEVMAIEDMGFARKGEGPKFIKQNALMINPSGGLKACGHALGATGIRQAADIVNRLKKSKIKFGLAQTVSGTGAASVVNIFGA